MFFKVIKTFGEDCVLGYGAGLVNAPGIKGPPAPSTSFQKKMALKLKVISVPEPYTTKTCSRCHGEAEPDRTR
jgi:hypothetical protein